MNEFLSCFENVGALLKSICIFVPLPSSQDIVYCLDSQYCSSERALLLFQLLSDFLSRAFSPKISSSPEQLVKE